MSLKIQMVKASGAVLFEGLRGGMNSSPNHPARRLRRVARTLTSR